MRSNIVPHSGYYPYGLPISGGGNTQYTPYLFGNKEFEDRQGLNIYDFGARTLAANAWTTPDPLAEKFYPLSPYSYCGGDPINNVDRDGRWRVDVHLEKDRSENGYGTAVVYSRNNEELFRFTVRAEGIKGHDRMKTGADTPLGTYDIPSPAWLKPTEENRTSYGPNFRLVMEGKSGEIIESGRYAIRMHGGRQEFFNTDTNQWEAVDEPTLKKTEGCLRAYDVDMRCFKAIIDEIETIDVHESPEVVNVMDDLDEFLNK